MEWPEHMYMYLRPLSFWWCCSYRCFSVMFTINTTLLLCYFNSLCIVFSFVVAFHFSLGGNSAAKRFIVPSTAWTDDHPKLNASAFNAICTQHGKPQVYVNALPLPLSLIAIEKKRHLHRQTERERKIQRKMGPSTQNHTHTHAHSHTGLARDPKRNQRTELNSLYQNKTNRQRIHSTHTWTFQWAINVNSTTSACHRIHIIPYIYSALFPLELHLERTMCQW